MLIVRLKMLQCARAWHKVAAVAGKLGAVRPTEALWPLARAEALRQGGSSRRARRVLLDSAVHFPKEAMIYYSLACVEVESGRMEVARKYLQIAFRHRHRLRRLAAQDRDLSPLYSLQRSSAS